MSITSKVMRPDGTGDPFVPEPDGAEPTWATVLRNAVNQALQQDDHGVLLYELEEVQFVIRDWISILDLRIRNSVWVTGPEPHLPAQRAAGPTPEPG